jgi:hypothetical protein
MKAQISLNGKQLYEISGITEIGLDQNHPGVTTLWAGKNRNRRIVASVPKGHTVVGIPDNEKKIEHIVDPEVLKEVDDLSDKLKRSLDHFRHITDGFMVKNGDDVFIPINSIYNFFISMPQKFHEDLEYPFGYFLTQEKCDLHCRYLNSMKKSVAVENKPKELTIWDYIKGNEYHIAPFGDIEKSGFQSCSNYPTVEIAEKVLLYGLLQSVAHKLNDGWNPVDTHSKWYLILEDCKLSTMVVGDGCDGVGCPFFKSRELAEQAIRIFENSKFDLKKLFV